MNKIGFNLLPWSAKITKEIYPITERLKTIGYDGVEVLIGANSKAEFNQYGQFLKDLDLESTAVIVLGESENPINSSQMVRRKAVDKIKLAIDMAIEIDAAILCGPFHSAHSTFSYNAPTEDEYNYSSEVLYLAGEYAQQANVVLALEAVNRFETYLCNTMEQLDYLVNKVNHPNVGAMFDTHHANIEEKSYTDSITQIKNNLVHFHISENDRGTPGKGLVRWDEVFSTLDNVGYKGWLTVESFSRNDPDFANAINVWREYSTPWEIAEEGYSFIKNNLLKL